MQVIVVDVVQVAVTVAMVDQVAVMDELEPVEAMAAEKVFIQEVHIYLHRVKDMMVQIMARVDLVVLLQVPQVEQAQFLLSQELQ